MATFQRLRLARERRTAAAAAAASAIATMRPGTAIIPAMATPEETELHTTMQEAVTVMERDTRPNNTAIAMDTKKEEWMQYCDILYPAEELRHLVTHEKAYNFMCYQMFREEKKRGGNKEHLKNGLFFDHDNYKKVTAKFKKQGGILIDYPKPTKPVGMASFTSYRAALKQLFHEQQARYRTITGTWELIWLPCFKKLQEHVKLRKARKKRENYEEKVDGAFAPYTMVEAFDDIEEAFWVNCNKPSPRQVNTALRHRFCVLYLTSGLLRSETIYNAEYSDFQSIIVDKNENDIHPIYVMIMQIPIGKTNKGNIRYGRATRHKNVKLCCVGALAFYTMYRFHHTGEFADMNLNDWLDNRKWFDIKLLSDLYSDNTHKMQNDSYSNKVKEILKALGLSCSKLLHLGRNLGSKLLDLLEEWKEEKRAMGQWSPDVMDNSYSSKLPMKPMRKLAGFTRQHQTYYNPRTQVEPSEELLRATPMGQWCYDAFDAVSPIAAEQRGDQHQTAVQVLKFFCYLNQIFLQDAAAMIVEDSDREEMPMFRELAVLRSQEFKDFTEDMRRELDGSNDPLDATLETVMPGVHERMGATHHEVELLRGEVQGMRQDMYTVAEDVKQDSRQRQEESDQRLALALRTVADVYAGRVEPDPQEMVARISVPIQTLAHRTGDSNPVSRPSPRTPRQDSDSDIPQETLADGRNAVRIPMERKHNSLQSVYNEWYGLDEYEDDHGGIVGREKKFKSTWRKNMVPPQHFSRVKRAIAGIEGFAKKNRMKNEEAVATLEALFVECKCSVANLVKKMSEQGYIEKKKPRGRKKNENSSNNTVSP